MRQSSKPTVGAHNNHQTPPPNASTKPPPTAQSGSQPSHYPSHASNAMRSIADLKKQIEEFFTKMYV